MKTRKLFPISVFATFLTYPIAAQDDPSTQMKAMVAWDTVATFSILGFDPVTGEVGGAVQSRVFSVGNGVLWADADLGIVATQAIVDVSYGPQSLALLREGLSPTAIIERIWGNDPDPDPDRWTKLGRQFAVMNLNGQHAVYTGPRASAWAGHRQSQYATAQGNILAGEEVVAAMIEAFEQTEGHLSHRLVSALEAGQLAGGDRRGMQSAALIVVKKDGGVWLNNDVVLRLQVDDSDEPIANLRCLVDKAVAMWSLDQPVEQRFRRQTRPASPAPPQRCLT